MMLACLLMAFSMSFMLKASHNISSITETELTPSSTKAPIAVQKNQSSFAKSGVYPELVEGKDRLVTITNNIKPDMLTYKHWTGKYNPDSFKIFVNDAEVAQGAAVELPAETKTVNVKFDYSFVNGKRTGSKTVSYKLNENITQANITFSWDNDNQIIIDNGTAIAS